MLKAYELRRPDGVSTTYLLPSDEAARNYAAGITERGVRVEIWAEGHLLASTYGTREDMHHGAWGFDQPSSQAGRQNASFD